MIFLDCFLGNIGLCLEDHGALSIKHRAFLSPPSPVTLACSLVSVQPPTKKQRRDGASKAEKQRRCHRGGRRSPRFYDELHATGLKEGSEGTENGKDKEEMGCR